MLRNNKERERMRKKCLRWVVGRGDGVRGEDSGVVGRGRERRKVERESGRRRRETERRGGESIVGGAGREREMR